jgi:2-hydroxy-6-oxonona-2,4-dienedioate hydrolase
LIAEKETEMLQIGNAHINYEIAGSGQPIVLIHAGVADSRQWNNEFQSFASRYQVIRYDLRGFGKSEPAEGDFSHLRDLSTLLDHIQIEQPLIIIGCSMGGGLALDFTLANPAKVAALILVGAAPAGLELDVQVPAKFELVEKADEEGDLDRVAELETQIWFDGSRNPDDVNKDMRKLAYEMNRLALSYESMQLGKRLPNSKSPAINHIGELDVPVLALVGAHDIPYMHAALTYMAEAIPNIRTVTMSNAAHLPNMDQPI